MIVVSSVVVADCVRCVVCVVWCVWCGVWCVLCAVSCVCVVSRENVVCVCVWVRC